MKLVVISNELPQANEKAVLDYCISHPAFAHFHLRRKPVKQENWTFWQNYAPHLVVSQELNCPFEVREHGNSEKAFSRSAHTVLELKEYQNSAVYISPVFESISKSGYQNKAILNELSQAKSIPENAVALGGVSIENLEVLKNLGFKNAAVLGAVWKTKDALESIKDLLEKAETL